ncbi:filamin-A isoform X3 [Aphidius gifuensis]|uniref:filamin-A isoform X3 n=1 Tax=Aphidius gifuensis TaxID=684658 RepID=UPI001CDB9241|nr:filamin-A isoform X3 [Aphidius gifuensis]
MSENEKSKYSNPNGEEEDLFERELAEDAVWKKIQQNTFTRWANKHLKCIDRFIDDLENDLSDGLQLINLIEVLAQKKLPKHNKKPSFRSQKLENVAVSLKFLENQGIRIVNIDSSDIVDSKLKLILGLIWTLILHYSISMPNWEFDNSEGGKNVTPKQRLMNWIQSKVPEIPLHNFTSDWNNGKAVGALVDAVAPGLCPDWQKWDPKDAVQNAAEAMGLADDWLNIPQLISPEEMVNPNVDELSMMTYLSQYPHAKLKPGAPLRPRTNPNSVPPPRVRAYGPGIEPKGPIVDAPANFTVETFSAGKGDVTVTVEDSKNNKLPVDIRFNNDRNLTYSVSYTPKNEGAHKVHVLYGGREIPKSPYTVQVDSLPGDPSKVTASGPGLQRDGVIVKRQTYFEIFTKDAGRGVPEVIILDPNSSKTTVPVQLRQTSPDVWRCDYSSTMTGLHSVNVFFAGKLIPKSPMGVNISLESDAKKCRAYGRGIQPSGVRVKDCADFIVTTKDAGEGTPEARCIGPGGLNVTTKMTKIDNNEYKFDYTPIKEGRHMVMVTYGGKEIPKSPFEVNVGPYKVSAIRVYGPGLTGGIVNHLAKFTVDTNGETGALGFSIEGPSKAKIDCHDNGDGTADVTFLPTAPGPYAVHILCDNEDIPLSPYISMIKPDGGFHPDKVEVSGPGIQAEGVNRDKQTNFTIDSRKAGKPAPVEVEIQDALGRNVPVKLDNKKDGIVQANYSPTSGAQHVVMVNYGGVATKKSPYRVKVSSPLNPSAVAAFGPGLDNGVKTNIPTHFNIDCREAGDGELEVDMTGPDGKNLPLTLTSNEDGTYTVDYSAPQQGPYKVDMTYGGLKVPQCPLKVHVQPSVDVSKIKVDGLESSPAVNTPQQFTIDTRAIPKPKGAPIDNSVTCKITNPSGLKTDKVITPQNDGTIKVAYTPFEEGPHKVDVLYDNLPVPGSPFPVNVKTVCKPEKCKAYGPGLDKGYVNRTNTFTVETTDAGTGGLGLAIEGPSEAQMSCKDNCDGTCTVDYIPTEAGDYDVAIKFDDKNIPGSPFKISVVDEPESNGIGIYGPGLQPDKIFDGVPAQFVVDTSKAELAQLNVKLKTDKGIMKKPTIKHRGDGIYDVSYIPPAAGANIEVGVLYGGKDVPGSPYKFKVNPAVDASKVKLSGPGVAPQTTASFPAEFIVDTSKAGYGDLEVQVLGPDQQPRKVNVQNIDDGKYKATYVPDDCGRYKVNVKYGGKEVPGSPVNVQSVSTGQADRCKIKEGIQKTVAPGEDYCINVDTGDAGNGALTCRIRSTSGSEVVDIDIEDKGDGSVDVIYNVEDAGDYTLSVKFGGQPVPNGFYTFKASEEYRETSTHKVQRRSKSHTHQEESVVQHTSSKRVQKTYSTERSTTSSSYSTISLTNIPLPSSSTTDGTVTSEVKMPSGNVDKPVIEDNHDGTVSIKYDPKEEGLHEVYVKYNGEHVQGSPYKFHVDSLSSGYVTAYGPGLIYGVCGEPANFTISTKGAGAGGLSLAVEGPSKADISCHDNKDGTVSVSYLPTSPGEYKVSVKFGDKPIKGSPYIAKITGEGRKRNQISVGSSSEVQLPGKVSDADIRSLNASITAPSGLEEPCFLKKMPSGNICVSFTPRESGEHIVAVKKMGTHIQNSPFKIDVKEREVGDAKKVKVTGKALSEGKTHVDNTFTIDTRNSGFGGLSLSMEGPSKAEIQCKDNTDGTLNISYKPTEPGYYIMNLKFADHHVDNSPFTIKVSGEGSNRQREKIQHKREAVPITEVGNKCKLTFKMPGITCFDLSSTVTSPGGVTEDAEIKEVEDGLYAVEFIPKELGVHTVSVRYKDLHIPGSPFSFTVGPLKDGGAHRVHAGGPGLIRGEQGEPCEFNIWTREAGAGTLAVSIEGPSKALIDFKDRKDGSCYVSYSVTEPGDYRVGIKFNDQHIPDSPHLVYISPAAGDAHKLEVAQFPTNNIQPDKPTTFLVRNNGAKGQLDGKIVSPSGVEDDCFIQAIDSEEYSVRFMPRENGIHNIHLKFNGVHINGSPLVLKVGKIDADPAAVHAYGNGLKDVKTGQKTDFIVDTCNAGQGALTVTVDGPSKVAMDCTEVEEGYKVRYTPLVPGDYYISVKYNSHHIVGSPFKITCTGTDLAERGAQETSFVCVETVQKFSKAKQAGPVLPCFKSDATKVTSKGMGLKKAYLGKQNQFTVNAGDAGNNLLFVGIYGPKGPCDEVYVKHTGRNNYNVSYIVRERGEYIALVKWGEDHVPGSPFKIEV